MRTKQTILLLHGWGISHKKYNELISIFEKKGFIVFSPDFPGFGDEKLTKESFTLSDYAAFVDKYIKKNNISDCIIIAHSFGGRVLVKYLSEYQNPSIKALVCSGTPLIRQNLPLKKIIISKAVKLVNNISLHLPSVLRSMFEKPVRKIIYRLLGEWDYYKAGNMRETFKNVIGESFDTSLKKIHIPTLLLWGKNDTFIPLSVCNKIHTQIEKSEIKIINGTHRLPYERPNAFAENTLMFLKNHKLT